MTQFYCQYRTGPALVSVGPDWKYFCWAALSCMCKNILRGHKVIMIEVSDVKKLGLKG